MKNIAIIGYNIFAPGGTTRSNINLINEFSMYDYKLKFFNYAPFSTTDVEKLKQREEFGDSVNFYALQNLDAYTDVDCYIITREAYFGLAKVIKSINPASKVIGEIHGPLPFINDNLKDTLPYFDSIRVSTNSIKEQFIKKFDYDRVFVQTVSLQHLKSLPQIESRLTNNLFIFSRFDEESKDIAYAIKLVAYMVNELGNDQIRLFINGYGVGESLYHQLVEYYEIETNVVINGPVPENYIYVSTSRYETFGYSIIEAISKGHRAALYCGDDLVVKENFQEFKTVAWLTKNVLVDANTLMEFLNKEPQLANTEYDHQLIERMSQNYVSTLVENALKYSAQIEEVNLGQSQIRAILDNKVKVNNFKFTQKIYTAAKDLPFLRLILKSNRFKKLALKIVDKVKKMRSNGKAYSLNENAYFIESFHGKSFSGDPKYLALAIKKINPNAEIYVSSVNELVDMEIRLFNMTPIRISSAEYVQKFKRCKYVIVNGNTIDLVGKQEGQVFVQTWHGFPLKRMVNDLMNASQKKKESKAFAPKMLKWDYLLTSSSYNTELLSTAFLLDSNEKLTILEEGLPKNEFLIANKEAVTLLEELHLKYFNKKYEEYRKYILFCPTWRKNKRTQITTIDLEELLALLPEEYEIIVKLHPNEGSLRNHYSKLDKRIHCFYNELVDIQELYLLSEVLISDYSSAIFDFAHLNKKSIVLQEDSGQYSNDVGWYFDLEKVCGLKAGQYSTEELVQKILQPENKDYNQRIVNNLLTNDQIGSTDKILKEILK